jgi:hypothetical protein
MFSAFTQLKKPSLFPEQLVKDGITQLKEAGF